jgi:hypothetical protein
MRSTAVVAEHATDDAHISAARIRAELPLVSVQSALQLIQHYADTAANTVVAKELDVFEMMGKVKDHRFADRIARETGTSATREKWNIMLPTDLGRRPDVVDSFWNNDCQGGNFKEASSGAIQL